MSGAIPAGFARVVPEDPFEHRNGLDWYRDPGGGRIELGLLADERHANEYGRVHGAVMMMMADAASCMNSRWHDRREGAITVSATCNFVEGARLGEFLQTSTRLLRRTRRFSFLACEVAVGERLCLAASAVVKRLLPDDG